MCSLYHIQLVVKVIETVRQTDARHQKVIGGHGHYLQIPVDDPVLVTMIDAFQNLLYAVRGISFWVKFPGNNVFEKLPTGNTIEQKIF